MYQKQTLLSLTYALLSGVESMTRTSAPKVVAKGAGLVALRIREIGAEHRVPTLEAPPLARALSSPC